MFKMPQAENNNQQAQPLNTPGQETWRQKYDRLTDGQKNTVLRNYRRMYGACIKTFFNKLNQSTRVRPSEETFFINNL